MTDSILRSYYNVSSSVFVPFAAPALPADLASELLTSETQGFAIFAATYPPTVSIIDTGTPANNLSDVDFEDATNIKQNGTSPKLAQFPTTPFARWTPHNLAFDSDMSGMVPNGASVSGTTITASAGSSSHELYEDLETTVLLANRVYTYSVKAAAGTHNFINFCLSGGSGTYYTVIANLGTGAITQTASAGSPTNTANSITSEGGGAYRITVTAALATAGDPFLFIGFAPAATGNSFNSAGEISGFSLTGSETFTASELQLNYGSTRTDFLATNGTRRAGIPHSYDDAEAEYAIWTEMAGTNLALQSDDFTNASWTKSNMSTAMTATGPDAVANSATTLTASAGNATALQAITSASATRITGMWVKRRTGTGNIDLTQNNGSTWQTMTVTSEWTRVALTAASLTNPTVGIRIVTNTDAVDVWGFQHETGDVLTSTIPTLSNTITRAVDNITVAATTFPYSTTVCSIYVDAKSKVVPNTLDPSIIEVGQNSSNCYGIRQDDANPVEYNVESGASDTSDFGTLVLNTRTQLSAAFKTADFDASQDGAAVVPDTLGNLANPAAGVTTLRIGGTVVASSLYFHGYIYKLVYVPRQVQTDAANLSTWRYNF